jgi:hypothetical protein
MTMADLDGRIASALSEPPLPSSEVATLIVQARTAVTEAQARAAAAKRRALNPRLPRGEVERARQAMESDHFIAERLQVALVELDARHGQLLADEEDARRIVRYAEVVAERDAAAAELREIYLPFAERFRDLMTRIGRIDIEVGIVNRHLPREKMPLADVEAVARGVCRNWHRQQSDLAVVYDRGAAGLGQRDLCVAAELANRRLSAPRQQREGESAEPSERGDRGPTFYCAMMGDAPARLPSGGDAQLLLDLGHHRVRQACLAKFREVLNDDALP